MHFYVTRVTSFDAGDAIGPDVHMVVTRESGTATAAAALSLSWVSPVWLVA